MLIRSVLFVVVEQEKPTLTSRLCQDITESLKSKIKQPATLKAGCFLADWRGKLSRWRSLSTGTSVEPGGLEEQAPGGGSGVLLVEQLVC